MKTPLLHTLGLWFLYRFAMWMKRHRDEIKHRGQLVTGLAYLALAFGWSLDVAYRCVYGTVLFSRLPTKDTLTFSALLKLVRKNPLKFSAQQRALADFFCDKMLNPYDPSGSHC